MRSIFSQLAWATILGIGVLQSGCGGSKPARFYLLTALPPAEAIDQQNAAAADISIGIGPVRFPDYLQRSQIVTFSGSNTISIAEFDRWAEPLEANFSRVLAENLIKLVPSEKVFVFPWKRATPIDYQVAIGVSHFEMSHDRRIRLGVRWGIISKEGDQLLVLKSASFSRSVNAENYDAIVAAMSAEVAELSREIALAIRDLAATQNH